MACFFFATTDRVQERLRLVLALYCYELMNVKSGQLGAEMDDFVLCKDNYFAATRKCDQLIILG